jgi:high affinity sulfate transporter 1
VLPGIAVLRSYRRENLRHDVTAGVVVTGLLVPAGMGYAEVAGLPAVTGLYATVVALVVYAILGPSRVLVLAPDSSLAPLIGAAVAPHAFGDPDRAVALAGLLAILAGGLLVAGGFFRFGFLTDFLATPIRIGYLNGIALVVIVSQLPVLLGFAVEGDSLVDDLRGLVDGAVDGDVVGAAAALGISALAVVVVLRRIAPGVPALLLAVVGPMLAVALLDLDVPVVGSLPRGLPSPALGGLEAGDIVSLFPAAAGLALVAFADTGALSRTFALRTGTQVDENREMVALGATNVACGTLGGFAVAASSSRTPVAVASGARTQLTGVVGAALVLLLLLLAPGLTRYLPSSALAAIVIAAVTTLVDVSSVLRLARTSRPELALNVVAFVAVALFGALRGLGIAIALALLLFIARAARPYAAELVRVERRKGYHDVSRHPEGRRIPGLVIARFDAPLFFANAGVFSDFVREVVDAAPTPARWVVLAAEPITDIDTTAADQLVELDEHLADRGVRLVFAELKGPVKDRLARYGLGDRFNSDRLFPTLGTAVSAYVAATGAQWEDWTDRPGSASTGD